MIRHMSGKHQSFYQQGSVIIEALLLLEKVLPADFTTTLDSRGKVDGA